MALIPILFKKLEGQEFIYNTISKTIIIEIFDPFLKAGKILNWDIKKYGSPGFGINHSIINFVIESRSKLLIKCDYSEQKEYWLTYDMIKQFIENNNSEYRTKGKWLYVLPWKLFLPKPNFTGMITS